MRNGTTSVMVAPTKTEYWEQRGFTKVEQARPAPKRRTTARKKAGEE